MKRSEAMAKKVSKYMLQGVVKDSKDTNLKEDVLNALEQAYLAGYGLAIDLCKEDNSKAGFEMAEHLDALQDDGTYHTNV